MPPVDHRVIYLKLVSQVRIRADTDGRRDRRRFHRQCSDSDQRQRNWFSRRLRRLCGSTRTRLRHAHCYNTFLDYTFFNSNTTKRFNKIISDYIQSFEFGRNRDTSIDIEECLEYSKLLLNTVRHYIIRFKFNHFLKNNLKKVIK